MLTPKQVRIFEAFLARPYKELTYKEVKEFSKERSNSVIQKAITKFLTNELIKKRNVGNVLLYQVNFENNMVFSYFDILLQEKLPPPVKRSLQQIKEELSDTPFVSVVVFGSYAEKTHTTKSDLDIAIIVRTKDDKRTCELSIKSVELKSLLPIDAHVFTKEELLSMLKDKHENLGKQIVNKHLAVHNPAIFYTILREGMDHGFKIVY